MSIENYLNKGENILAECKVGMITFYATNERVIKGVGNKYSHLNYSDVSSLSKHNDRLKNIFSGIGTFIMGLITASAMGLGWVGAGVPAWMSVLIVLILVLGGIGMIIMGILNMGGMKYYKFESSKLGWTEKEQWKITGIDTEPVKNFIRVVEEHLGTQEFPATRSPELLKGFEVVEEHLGTQEFLGLVHVLREIGYKTFKKGTLMPCDLVAEGKKYYGCEATFYFIYKESFSEEEFEKYITSIENFVKTRPTGLLDSLLQFVIASEKGFPSSFAEKVSKVTKKFNTPIYYVVLFDLSNNKMVFPNAGIIGSLAPRVSMNDLQKLEKIKLREVPVAGTHFCPKCGINVETQRFCPKCKRDLITGDTGKKTDSETKDIISLIANVFIPGVGTIIHGETMRGVVQLVLGIFGIITLILLIGFLIMPLIWLWAVIDGIFFVMKKELIFPSLK